MATLRVTLRQVFPAGTRFIWTHRDLRSSIPSLCSLFQTMIEVTIAPKRQTDHGRGNNRTEEANRPWSW